MPTTRRRHVITETDDIARALDAAAHVWPADRGNRKALLLHLISEGVTAATARGVTARSRRVAEVRDAAGAGTGTYEAGYLETLRRDWER